LEQTIEEIEVFNKNWHVAEKCPEGLTALEFYEMVISDPRGLPWSEGVVVKDATETRGSVWFKVKNRELEDFEILELRSSAPGTKYEKSAALMTVRDPVTGHKSEVGSFAISDTERQWMFDHREEIKGSIVRVRVMEKTKQGAARAGTFEGFHPDPRRGGIGAERGLQMYAEALSGMDPEESKRMVYRLKSSQGWKR
jgi:ATP-dependent DNA ligase